MKHHSCISLLLIAVQAYLSVAEQDEEPKKPNLIMIMVDEHNLKTLGCYRDLIADDDVAYPWGRNAVVDTPHLDTLAKEGAIYKNYYAVAPLCTPSRASFFSGQYPPATGADKNHGRMNTNVKTFAHYLRKEAGYYTGFFGKFHLDGKDKPGWKGDPDRKFGFVENKYRYNRGHWKFFERKGKDVVGYEWNAQDKFAGNHEKHYATDFIFDQGMNFIGRQLDKDRHFAMVMSIPDPHAPNVVREPYNSMFDDMFVKYPETASVAAFRTPATPSWLRMDDEIFDDPGKHIDEYEKSYFWQSHMRGYYGMVKCIDDNMKKLMDYLKAKGIDDNTIIVFTADHGDTLGEHGKLNKGKPYESSAGVPFLLRYPEKVKANKVIETSYSSIDFAPTILALMGVNVTDTVNDFHGIDGSEELLNDNLSSYKEQVRFIYDAGKHRRWAAAVMGKYKLVMSKTDVPWLYDLEKDGNEIHNYFDDKENAPVVNFLRQALIEELQKFDVPLFEQRAAYWDTPACMDSRDVMKGRNVSCDKYQFNAKARKAQCRWKRVRLHCPVSCNTCCEDSQGQLLLQGELRKCEELKGQCNNKKVKKFCPRMCRQC